MGEADFQVFLARCLGTSAAAAAFRPVSSWRRSRITINTLRSASAGLRVAPTELVATHGWERAPRMSQTGPRSGALAARVCLARRGKRPYLTSARTPRACHWPPRLLQWFNHPWGVVERPASRARAQARPPICGLAVSAPASRARAPVVCALHTEAANARRNKRHHATAEGAPAGMTRVQAEALACALLVRSAARLPRARCSALHCTALNCTALPHCVALLPSPTQHTLPLHAYTACKATAVCLSLHLLAC